MMFSNWAPVYAQILLRQLCVVSVRVGGDGVHVACQCLPQEGRDAEGVYICGKTGDVFFFDSVDFFDFLQVAAVKMVFMFQHMNASVPFIFRIYGVIGGAAEVAPLAFVVYNCTIQDSVLK